MRHSEQIRILENLMQHLDNDTNVDAGCQVRNPVSSYTSTEIAEREWQSFFLDYPQLLGLSSDLPEAGSFFTSNDLGKPILCTRDKDGQFHAFLNVCRHRGAIVESAQRGRKSLFSCPFHAWSYASNGDLMAVPKEQHFGPVDRECHSLVALPAEERYGILWVHPNPQGTLEVDNMLGELAAEFDSWNLQDYNYQGQTSFDHSMNWKLAIDTFGETYHFGTLHKNTLAQDFHGNVQTYDIYERNHRMMLCLKNIDTMRHEPPKQWHVLRGALPVYYIFPNVQLIIGAGGPTLVRIYPDGANPHQSASQISFYLDPELSDEQPTQNRQRDFDIEDVMQRMQGFAEVIRDEDYVAAAGAHRGATSGAQEYVTFGRNEPALHHYHNTYRAALDMPPLTVISNQNKDRP